MLYLKKYKIQTKVCYFIMMNAVLDSRFKAAIVSKFVFKLLFHGIYIFLLTDFMKFQLVVYL